jgi:hypothetical protein
MVVESTDLAVFLEYTQPGSVRKQILGDWAQWFVEFEHYFLVTSTLELEEWERRRQRTQLADSQLEDRLAPLASVSRKGRLFLLETGLEKFLRKTSKPRAQALQLALAAVSPVFRGPDLEDGIILEPPQASELKSDPASSSPALEELESRAPSDPAQLTAAGSSRPSDPRVALESSDDPGLSLEERRFRHDVLQTLLQNVAAHRTDPVLMHLAHSAAEEALGYELAHLPQVKYLPRASSSLALEEPSSAARDSSARESSKTPMPEDKAPSLCFPGREPPPKLFSPGMYTMSAIGRAAGGYSAVSTGKAADIVAAAFGIASHTLRTQATRYSRLVTLPERYPGRPRLQVEFMSLFADLIAQELRMNPDFQPVVRAPLTEFDAGGANLPKLSQPLDLESASS